MWPLEALVPLEEDDVTSLGDSHTHTCDLLRRRFHVLALYFYVGGYFGGRPRPIHLVSWIYCILGASREVKC
jgi:hypothetical protein